MPAILRLSEGVDTIEMGAERGGEEVEKLSTLSRRQRHPWMKLRGEVAEGSSTGDRLHSFRL
jgi:hypothetical protein